MEDNPADIKIKSEPTDDSEQLQNINLHPTLSNHSTKSSDSYTPISPANRSAAQPALHQWTAADSRATTVARSLTPSDVGKPHLPSPAYEQRTASTPTAFLHGPTYPGNPFPTSRSQAPSAKQMADTLSMILQILMKTKDLSREDVEQLCAPFFEARWRLASVMEQRVNEPGRKWAEDPRVTLEALAVMGSAPAEVKGWLGSWDSSVFSRGYLEGRYEGEGEAQAGHLQMARDVKMLNGLQ